jgi:hypothetical protein
MYLAFSLEIIFSEKGKLWLNLTDEKWLCDLPLLCDVSHHTNYLCLGLSELLK